MTEPIEPTYFSLLSVDALQVITKAPGFEKRPSLHFWMSGPFARAIPALFPSITLGMGDLPVADIATREIHVGMGVDLNILGRYCKKSFKQLTIHPTFFPIFDRRDQNILASLFAPDALLHITSSGSGHIEFFHQLVSFVGILGSSFSGFKVDWSYQTKFRNIPRDLLDSVSSWNHLKEFHYSGANPAALSTLWPKVGSSLVNLKVSIPRKSAVTSTLPFSSPTGSSSSTQIFTSLTRSI